MTFIHINQDFPLYYEDKGSGKPIVFIHPPGMGSVTFKQQHELASKYRVITFDLRGNGRSGFTAERITIPLLANDVLQLINSLSLDKITVCGYSNGGSIALDFVINNPDRVEGIILLGSFPEVNTFLLRSEFLMGIYTVKWRGLPFLAKVLGQAHGVSKEYKKEIENYVLKANTQILRDMYVEGLHYKCTHRLKEIKVPVLLIDGARDFYMHSYQKLFEKEIKKTSKVLIPKAKHQLPTKHSSELNQIIDNYMERI